MYKYLLPIFLFALHVKYIIEDEYYAHFKQGQISNVHLKVTSLQLKLAFFNKMTRKYIVITLRFHNHNITNNT
jgi:hypothetical protein